MTDNGRKRGGQFQVVMRAHILVVDDEEYICAIVHNILSDHEGHHVTSCSDPAEAIRMIQSERIDLVLTDMIMGDYSGIDILRACEEHQPDSVVIFMTGHPTIENAISVLKRGVYDYLVKPFKLENLRATVERGLEKLSLQRENVRLKNAVSLYKISAAMGSTIHLDSLLKLVLESVIGGFDAGLATIALVDSETNELQVQAFHGDWETISGVPFLTGKDEIPETVVETGDAKIVKNIVIENADSEQSGGSAKAVGICVPLFAKGSVIGVLSFVRFGLIRPFTTGDLHSISIIAAKAASAIESSMLYDELEDAYLSTIRALANSIEARDNYTRGHAERVTHVAEMIARGIGWGEEEIRWLRIGGTLHDIGKIGVPDCILNKPGPLSDEEFEVMKKHPETGSKLLEGIPFLKPIRPYVLCHHEKWDGSGYPAGLKGEDIPIEGRLLAVADTVDAILTNRPYRAASALEKVIDELTKFRGRQFDPILVDSFLELINSGGIDLDALYGFEEAETDRAQLTSCPVHVAGHSVGADSSE